MIKKGNVPQIIIGLIVLSGVLMVPFQMGETQITVQLLNLSPFAPMPPTIDGVVSTGEWDIAVKYPLAYGWVLAQNDATALYLLIDLTSDTGNDPPQETEFADGFWLTFDANLDGEISGADINYALYPGTYKLGMQHYIGPGEKGELKSTNSQLGVGFGESINSRESHRIFELAINLLEICPGRAEFDNSVRLGLRVFSGNPRFTLDEPEEFFQNFANLWKIDLTMPQIDLLILTDEAFYEALKPLKAHKEYTGIPTYVQSWQSLNKIYGSVGRDIQERIKIGIADYEQSCGTKYIMLCGDSDRFPVRYCKIYDPKHWGNQFAPSDLYYADLYKMDGSFDDWDGGKPPYGGNGLFGEMNGIPWQPGWTTDKINLDNVDLHPDVAVGRVPASSVTEVKNYVEKVITYEFSAYNTDWMKNALLVVPGYYNSDKDIYEDLMGALNTHEYIAANLSSIGITSTKLYDPRIANIPFGITYSDPTPGSINAALNQGVGFMSFGGHGNVGTLAGAYDLPNLELSFGAKIKWKDYFGGGGEILQTGDVNADGRSDLIEFDTTSGEVWVSLSSSSGAGPTTKWHSNFCIGNEIPKVGDIDGDQKADIVKFIRSTKPDPDKGDVYVAFSTGSSFSKATKWHDFFCVGEEIPDVGDFNGDGKSDVITFIRSTKAGDGKGDVIVSLSDGYSFGPGKLWHGAFCLGQELPDVGDFNGDGKSDVITFIRSTKIGGGKGDVFVALSDGNGFTSTKLWHGDFCFGQNLPRVGDVDGNGKDDIICFSRGSAGNVYVALSKGNGFGPAPRWQSFFCLTGQWPEVDDVDGDGTDDLICFTGPTPVLGPDLGAVFITSKLTLNNAKKLPIVFADACYTAKFHFGTKYLDTTGKEYDGKVECPNPPFCFPLVTAQPLEVEMVTLVSTVDELEEQIEQVDMELLELSPIEIELLEYDPEAFIGIDATNLTSYCYLTDFVCNPPEPAAIQRNATKNYDVDSLVEQFLVRRKTGAIAYIGAYTGTQNGGRYLDKYFIEAYMGSSKPAIIGSLWNQAINKYINNKFHFNPMMTSSWIPQAMYHHIQKYWLYGDPSLRIGGVPNLMATLATKEPPLIVVQILPELFQTTPPETIETSLTLVETTTQLTTYETTFEAVELVSNEIEECKINIHEVIGEGSRGDQIERILVMGNATGCHAVEVSFSCGALKKVAEVNPDTQGWLVIFEREEIPDECFCGPPIEVRACALDPPIEECCAFFIIPELPCPPPIAAECHIEIIDIYGHVSPDGIVESVFVNGFSENCEVLEMTIICGTELTAAVEVNPFTGEWEAIFEDVPADCTCEHPIEVIARCIQPYNEECSTSRIFDNICPPMTSEPPEAPQPETSQELSDTTSQGSGSVPGFGHFEMLIAIFLLMAYRRYRSSR